MRTDFILDENKDIIINNGDFQVAKSDEQNIGIHIELPIGHFKQNPTIGVGIVRNTKGILSYELKGAIRKELSEDGYNLNMIYQDLDGKINIDAS